MSMQYIPVKASNESVGGGSYRSRSELYNALYKANVDHLIDLKRAGHSAALTELLIAADRLVPLRYYGETHMGSGVGSPANSCADFSGYLPPQLAAGKYVCAGCPAKIVGGNNQRYCPACKDDNANKRKQRHNAKKRADRLLTKAGATP